MEWKRVYFKPTSSKKIEEKLSQEKVKLWTMQSLSSLKRMEETGVLTGNPFPLLENDPFYEGMYYQWMKEQMAKRLENFSGDFPVWCKIARPNFRFLHSYKGFP